MMATKSKLLEIVSRYGKYGVMVDDSEDADLRLARDLYGGEILPAWWLVVGSKQCAREVLVELAELADGPAEKRPPGLVVIDRKLPPKCGDLGRTTEIDDLDELERVARGEAVLSADTLAAQVAAERRLVVLITSYPHELDGIGPGHGPALTERRLPWQTRNLELFARARRLLRQAELFELLRYGPEENPPSSIPPEDQYMRRHWLSQLKRIAEALGDPDQRAVLLLGAGASLANGYYGCGMPPTDWILRKAAELAVNNPARIDAGKVGSPRQWTGCQHCARPAPAPPRVEMVKNVEELIEAVEANQPFGYRLEHLFSPRRNTGRVTRYEQFVDAFFQILHLFDHGYPYHYWLLADLPWSAVITTNFDRLFERAAYARAERAEGASRRRYLRWTSILPPSEYRSLSGSERGQLLKPYGTLDGRGAAMSVEEFLSHKKRVKEAFARTLAGKGAVELVVLGQAMEDPGLQKGLKACRYFDGEGKPGKAQAWVHWIGPRALESIGLSSNTPGRHRDVWCEFMHQGYREFLRNSTAKGRTQAVPLSARAIDFCHDLFAVWRQQQA